jgi:flagellar biosynthesis GTPase FlhF
MTNQNNRKSFIIHKDSLVILNEMSNEQAGIFIKAIKFYQEKGHLPNLDFGLKMAITPFINQFQRDEENYKNTCEARKLAGSKGGKQKVANASKSYQKVANVADNDSKNENESKNENKNESESEIKNNPNKTKKFIKPSIQEIKDYCQERKNSVDAEKFFDHYESIGWKKGKTAIKDWKACVRTWEKNGYSSNSKNQTGYQDTYSYNPNNYKHLL